MGEDMAENDTTNPVAATPVGNGGGTAPGFRDQSEIGATPRISPEDIKPVQDASAAPGITSAPITPIPPQKPIAPVPRVRTYAQAMSSAMAEHGITPAHPAPLKQVPEPPTPNTPPLPPTPTAVASEPEIQVLPKPPSFPGDVIPQVIGAAKPLVTPEPIAAQGISLNDIKLSSESIPTPTPAT